jgi:TatA/E family protein of Tat protein translocase
MFGSLGFPELLLIFVVILIVFGPRRIPEIGRTLGKAMGEFRRATDDLKGSIEREVRLEELKNIAPPVSFESIASSFDSVSRNEPLPSAESTEEPPAGGTDPTAEPAIDGETGSEQPSDETPAPSRTA